MSVRTDARDLSQQLQQTLTIPADQMLAAAGQQSTGAPAADAADLTEAGTLGSTAEHPLHRTVCINIRASLSDLCLKSSNATWQPPSAEANKAIFQQA